MFHSQDDCLLMDHFEHRVTQSDVFNERILTALLRLKWTGETGEGIC